MFNFWVDTLRKNWLDMTKNTVVWQDRDWQSERPEQIESFHFKKTVAQSSFLAKVLSFLLKSKQSQQKLQHF